MQQTYVLTMYSSTWALLYAPAPAPPAPPPKPLNAPAKPPKPPDLLPPKPLPRLNNLATMLDNALALAMAMAMNDVINAFLARRPIAATTRTAKPIAFNLTKPKIGTNFFKIFFLVRPSTTNSRTVSLTSSGIALARLRPAVAKSHVRWRSVKNDFKFSVKYPSNAISRAWTVSACSTSGARALPARSFVLANETPPNTLMVGWLKNSRAWRYTWFVSKEARN